MTTVVRRLTAIMFTDVVGYSKLMATDERLALAILHRQRELLPAIVAGYNGTLHKEIGDGTLSSFASAVDALHCARALQQALSRPSVDEAFQVRIGLHIGDVVFEGEDVFGDGVNVASRIEPLAPPGGIALSGQFYSAVRSQSDLKVHSLGDQVLKGIDQPVAVYVVGEAPAVQASPSNPAKPGYRRWAMAGAVALLAVVLAWVFRDRFQSAAVPATAVTPPSAAVSAPLAAVEKSIAVLPFVNMSADKDQEYFSDGISEELLNQLANVSELKVIARTSSFSFKGKDVPIGEIAKQLNVAHVLEGSVRKANNTVRITAQLIRASDSVHLWSATYDRPLDDIFKVQDEIAGAITQALQIRLKGGTVIRSQGGTENLQAFELYLRALSAHGENSRSSIVAASDYLKRAIELDPGYGLALASSAEIVVTMTDNGFLLPADGYERARTLAKQALQATPDIAISHSTLQYIHLVYDLDWAAARSEGQKALAIDQSNPWVLYNDGIYWRVLGRWSEAERQTRSAMDRDPFEPYTIWNLALIYYLAGRFDDSELMYRRLLDLEPNFLWTRTYLAKTLLAKGEADAALAVVEQEPDAEWRALLLPIALWSVGRSAESDDALEQLISKWADSGAYFIAETYAFRGDHDKALEWLDRAHRQKDPYLIEISGEPLFKPISADARFKAFLRKMNLPETPPG